MSISHASSPVGLRSNLHTNPHHTDHNVHPLALPALILETPHAIALVVPVSSASTVHAPATNLLARLSSLFHLLRAFGPCASRLRQVLDDCAVDGEFVAVGSQVGRF